MASDLRDDTQVKRCKSCGEWLWYPYYPAGYCLDCQRHFASNCFAQPGVMDCQCDPNPDGLPTMANG